jgi:putative two-component system response regulator
MTETAQLLIVDDERPVRRMMHRILEREGYRCQEAGDAAQALSLMNGGGHGFDLAICDVALGGESGLDLADQIHRAHPDTAILMASGLDSTDNAVAASERGAYGYLVKPFTANELLINVANALMRRQLEMEERDLRERLESEVQERTKELRATVQELEASRRETVHRLVRAVEMRDMETGGHVERIGAGSALLAERLGLGRERAELIRLAAPMHDVGKIGIPDEILRKPGVLTDPEREQMQRHAQIGYVILAGSGGEMLDLAALIALTHHEWWDGTGYPRGLAGEDIPLEGRIVAVADVFDALTSNRVYRPAFDREAALRMMRDERGTHFDPRVLDVLLDDPEAFGSG